MTPRFPRRLQFRLERLLLRGAFVRLALTAVLILSVALGGGTIVYLTDAGAFPSYGDAVWWAFLRLTDPGYLGDDHGTISRTVSVVITVAGYVFFMGALIAIMTQWLDETLERLARGETPIALRNHILILGWTERTPQVVRQLVLSEDRVARFLRSRGRPAPFRIAVLVEDLRPEHDEELRTRLGEHYDGNEIILRSGTGLRVEHLERVDFSNAAAIIIPGENELVAGEADNDTSNIKTLLTIANHPGIDPGRPLPRVVTELFDYRRTDAARSAYRGSVAILPSDRMVARVLVQCMRHPGLSLVIEQLLTHEYGCEIYFPRLPQLTDMSFAEASAWFDESVLLGVTRTGPRGTETHLDPAGHFRTEPDDRYIVMAHKLHQAKPISDHPDAMIPRPPIPTLDHGPRRLRRILLLGWCREVPSLLDELSRYDAEPVHVEIFSKVSITQREQALSSHRMTTDTVTVTHHEGDYTLEGELASVHPETFDTVTLLGNDWLQEGEEADARTVVGALILRRVLAGVEAPPQVLLELSDPSNIHLFEDSPGEVVASSTIMAHMLALVAIRPELVPVFQELFQSGGTEIFLRSGAQMGLEESTASFGQIQDAAAHRGEIAIGVFDLLADGTHYEVHLSPGRSRTFDISRGECIVVIGWYDHPSRVS